MLVNFEQNRMDQTKRHCFTTYFLHFSTLIDQKQRCVFLLPVRRIGMSELSDRHLLRDTLTIIDIHISK